MAGEGVSGQPHDAPGSCHLGGSRGVALQFVGSETRSGGRGLRYPGCHRRDRFQVDVGVVRDVGASLAPDAQISIGGVAAGECVGLQPGQRRARVVGAAAR